MIQMPRRSITRFFIPMIDVLTLLFCIYLLMPMVRNPDQAKEDRLRKLEEELRRAEALRKSGKDDDITERLRAEVEKLRKEKIKVLRERLAVRVLQIDGATGKLYPRGENQPITDLADARKLIKLDQQRLGAGKSELYYLILYPPDPESNYPTRAQKLSYDRWFADVALGYDDPGR